LSGSFLNPQASALGLAGRPRFTTPPFAAIRAARSASRIWRADPATTGRPRFPDFTFVFASAASRSALLVELAFAIPAAVAAATNSCLDITFFVFVIYLYLNITSFFDEAKPTSTKHIVFL
jgi:hypothetical protein